VSDHQLFEDEVLERVRESGPVVPDDLLSLTGASAQRVLARVLATSTSADTAADGRAPASSPARAGRSSWLTRRRVGALAGVVVAVAAVVAILAIGSGGGGPSILGRAYAATNPAGVIVHYIETTRSSLQTAHRFLPQVTEFWIDGRDTHQIIDGNDGKARQDIVTSGGRQETLTFGNLVIAPAWPASTKCAPALVLTGDCAEGRNSTPIDGLRSLLRAKMLHLAGTTMIAGRRVDVLTGTTGNLRIRALIDASTFVPVRVDMVLTFAGHANPPVTNTLMITGYQRLPATPGNRKLLALPAHPNVRVIRLHVCPTKANPRKLCR
jgi:hypothetical protein